MKRVRLYLIAFDIALIITLPFIGTIAKWMMDNIPRCIVAQHGLLCPACGGTRCIRYLSSGNFINAFLVNPYLFLTILYLITILLFINIMVLSNGRFGRKTFRRLTDTKLLIAWGLGFAAFGVFRNFI